MKKMRQWDESLNVGVDIIDNQHKIIIDLIGDFGNAAAASADRKILDTLLDVITNYIHRHFETEEECIRQQAEYVEHCQRHYALTKELHKYRLSLRNRSSQGAGAAEFLEAWFLDHIRSSDIPLFAPDTSPEDRLPRQTRVDAYPFEQEDRRRHQRIPSGRITDDDIIVHCYNTSNLRNSAATIMDISPGGMRFNSTDRLKVGDLLIISCHIGRNFGMKEKVRITNDSGEAYGAEFITPANATEQFLAELYGSLHQGGK